MRKVLYRSWAIIDRKTVFSDMNNEGYFHKFINYSGDICAIIESKMGDIVVCDIDKFKFVDSPEAIDWEQRRYEIAREQMAHGVIPRMAVNDADCLIEALKGKSE